MAKLVTSLSIKDKSLAEKFLLLVQTQGCTTEALRENWSGIEKLYGVSNPVGHFSEITGTFICICDACGLPELTSKTYTVYSGAYSICETCKPQFSTCETCKTLVLTSDLGNPSHIHLVPNRKKALFENDDEVEVWNADIMGSERAFYLKTKKESDVWKHQKEAFQPTIYSAHKEVPFRYFGIELEVEKIPCAPPDMIRRARKLLGRFAMVKHDGSISKKGKNGFEIVSVPATLAYHKDQTWDSFYDQLGPFFLESPPSTGLHIHVGTSTITKMTVGKMLIFINSLKNREFIESLAGRPLGVPSPTNGKVYAQVTDNWKISSLISLRQHNPNCPWDVKNKKFTNQYVLENGQIKKDTLGHPIISSIKPSSINIRPTCKCADGKYNIDKYQAFRVATQRPTVEVRIFRGIVNKNFLYTSLEFVDALIDYCSDASTGDLGYEKFLKWLCRYNQSGHAKLYPNLSRYLINRGWIDPPKDRSVAAFDLQVK